MKDLKKHIEGADAVLITAGAGMSAESNISTYRDSIGDYRDLAGFKGLGYEQLANEHFLRKNPLFCWEYYAQRTKQFIEAKPHRGYVSLLKILTDLAKPYFIFTSNIDGLFLKAGFFKHNIIEWHGSLFQWQCMDGCQSAIWPMSLERLNAFIGSNFNSRY